MSFSQSRRAGEFRIKVEIDVNGRAKLIVEPIRGRVWPPAVTVPLTRDQLDKVADLLDEAASS